MNSQDTSLDDLDYLEEMLKKDQTPNFKKRLKVNEIQQAQKNLWVAEKRMLYPNVNQFY